MIREPASVTSELHELFDLLITRPLLKRGMEWSTAWEGWDKDTWNGYGLGVYILWQNPDDLKNGIRPLYVGEGISGSRIWDHFQNRKDWGYAQIFYDERISNVNDGLHWRKLLERFSIVVLQPTENLG